MRFYLDQDLSDAIAIAARALGIDVVSSHTCGKDGVSDDAQLAYAATEGRCIVTANRADLYALAIEYAHTGRMHSEILPLPSSLAHMRGNVGAIARALERCSRQHPEEVIHHADWLRRER